MIHSDSHRNLSITVGTNATVYSKTVLELSCNASGSPSPKIRWSYKGREIFTRYIDNKLLLFHDPDQSGEYSCEAENVAGKARRSSYIKFIEPIPPKIVSSRGKIYAINGENDISFKIGDDVTTIAGTALDIECLADGNPKPTITWYHNGEVGRNTHLISLHEQSYFYNKAIEAGAAGNYTCVATNGFGNDSVTSIIDVIEPIIPYIKSSKEDIVSYDMTRLLVKTIGGSLTSLVGVSISLECPVGGIPPPEVKWEKDKLPISPSKRVKVYKKRMEVLGTIMSDTGLYSCTASNGAGVITESTFVHLIAPEKPRIKRINDRRSYIVDKMPTPFSISVGINLRILAHRELTLHCSATGFPRPVLSWQRNGKPIVNKMDLFVSKSGDKLVFKYLTPSQNGHYSCTATNTAGRDIVRTTVVSRLPMIPKIEIRRIVLNKYQLSPQKNVKVYELPQMQPPLVRGSDVILECIARRGYPKPIFKWFKDGRRIRTKITKVFYSSHLKIRNIKRSDEGTYKCFASNVVGQQEKTTVLRLEGHGNISLH